MYVYDTALWVVILLIGVVIVTLLKMGERMDKFNQAIARLQDSANKITAKVDTLNAGTDAALYAAADQINAVSDQLDAKSA